MINIEDKLIDLEIRLTHQEDIFSHGRNHL